MDKLNPDALAVLFTEGRTHNHWKPEPVSESLLRELYDLTKFAPTSANSCPMRVVFVQSAEAKARLKPLLSRGNVDKTMAAPVTAILAYDLDFAAMLPKLMPHVDARPWFEGTPDEVRETALRSATLQAGFFILAARSLGLDTGPMSGFNAAAVNEAFFAGTSVRANFLVNLGYGETAKLHPRLPRLSFEEVCRIV